jgi:hypothetical protein
MRGLTCSLQPFRETKLPVGDDDSSQASSQQPLNYAICVEKDICNRFVCKDFPIMSLSANLPGSHYLPKIPGRSNLI